MNVEQRIARLEVLLSAVAQHRRNLMRVSPRPVRIEADLLGWTGVERGYQTALSSARAQRGRSEITSEVGI